MTEIDNELRSLVGVRAFAAGLVVFWHFHLVLLVLAPGVLLTLKVPVTAAILAVDFFFMLSGFILAEKYLRPMRRLSWEETRHFYTLRFARLWPVHAAMVVAFLAYHRVSLALIEEGMDPHAVRWTNVVMNLAMLHEVPPATPIDIPAWSIGVEVGAYLLFPLLALVLVRVRTASSAMALAAILLVVGAWVHGQLFDHRDTYAVAAYVGPWVRIGFGFVAGALLNVGWHALRSGRYGRGWDATAVASVVAIFTIIVAVAWSGPLVLPAAAYPFLGLLVLACAGATGLVGRLLGSGPVEWAGRLSYSIYMTHYLVVIALQSAFTHLGAASFGLPARLLLVALSVLAVAGASVVSYYAVEEPARQWIRRWEYRRRQRRPAATSVDPEGSSDG